MSITFRALLVTTFELIYSIVVNYRIIFRPLFEAFALDAGDEEVAVVVEEEAEEVAVEEEEAVADNDDALRTVREMFSSNAEFEGYMRYLEDMIEYQETIEEASVVVGNSTKVDATLEQ